MSIESIGGNDFINNTLCNMDKLLENLKLIDQLSLPCNVKHQLTSIYEKCGFLTSNWDSGGIDNVSRIDDSLWDDNYFFRYLFNDCITKNVYTNNDLSCIVCGIDFEQNKESLKQHLNDESHVSNFKKNYTNKSDLLWGSKILYKMAFEKFLDARNDCLFCKLCAVSVPATQIKLFDHLNSATHLSKFKTMMEYKFFPASKTEFNNRQDSTGFLSADNDVGIAGSSFQFHSLPILPMNGIGEIKNENNISFKINKFTKKMKPEQRSSYWYGITDLPADITESDLKTGFSELGEVGKVVLKKEEGYANVFVNLRSELQKHAKNVTNEHEIKLKGTLYPIQDRINVLTNVNAEVKTSFSNISGLVAKLSTNAKKEYDRCYAIFGNSIIVREAVINDIEELLALNVISIGSRATGLAELETTQDVYISFGNMSVPVSKSHYLESKLNDSSVFTDVASRGNIIVTKHRLTKTKCKLYIDDDIVLEKSNLIKLYLEADERIWQLALTVRYWASFTDLPVSNYAITWMVLFYLMQPEAYFLKPVVELKSNLEEPIKKVKGWTCGFSKCQAPSVILRSSPKLERIEDLIEGFFKFYGKTSFRNCVLSPLIGEILSKSFFLKPATLPDHFKDYVNICSDNSRNNFQLHNKLNLQDPVQLNDNLTLKLDSDYFDQFRSMCENTFMILQKSKKK